MGFAEILGQVPFNAHLGLEVLEAAGGNCAVRLPDRAEHHNHVGGPHAGALFSLAEAASGGAVLSALAERLGGVTPLAKGGEIKYRKLAMGPVTARARLVEPLAGALERLDREGRVDVPVAVDIVDGNGVVVAEASFVWALRQMR
jgi:uncharacterized protein (TIGR00369 family)